MRVVAPARSLSVKESDVQDLRALGYGPEFAGAFQTVWPGGDAAPARVCEEQRGALRVLCAAGELPATVSGRLSYAAAGVEDLPAVGDWVVVTPRPEGGAVVVQAVLPRRTALVRKAPERPTNAQVLAANLDRVLLVTSANRDFNPRRIERALALVAESGAAAVVVLSKRDLCADPAPLLAEARAAAAGAPVLALSSFSGDGLEQLEEHLEPGSTAVLLGSSGVGKSTLLNRLLGREEQVTKEIRGDDDRGRHATTHRQLVPLPGGALLVDTPGLREIGLFDDEAGLDDVFPEVAEVAARCRFRDCGHGNEPGCAVRAALEDGTLDAGRLAHQAKLERELEHVRLRRDALARHERRKKMKKFARSVRSHKDRKRPPP